MYVIGACPNHYIPMLCIVCMQNRYYYNIMVCCCRTPSSQDVISPRVAVFSGSRRRRRRKNSQSDSKKQPSPGLISPIPHCVSPVDTTFKDGSISEQQTAAGNDSPERLFSPVSSGKRPPSAVNGVRPNSAGKCEKARARLLDRFETAGSQESGDEIHSSPSSYEMAQSLALAKEPTESPEKPTFAVSVVQPIHTGRPAKGGWANLPKMYVHVDDYVSMGDTISFDAGLPRLGQV